MKRWSVGGRGFERNYTTYLIVVRRQLLQELSHSVPFSHTVHVGHFVLGNLRKVQMDLGIEDKRKELVFTFCLRIMSGRKENNLT